MAKKGLTDFEIQQKKEIVKRLEKYKNPKTIQNQIEETGDLSTYQKYKIGVVSKYLIKALEKINKGTYGSCDICKNKILEARLELVPAALTCVNCDPKKESLT